MKSSYSPPSWSAEPEHPYAFEVIKNGACVDNIALDEKPFLLVGRNRDICQLVMEHPSISRHHAVIQHRGGGKIYIFEMGSTHGTFVNKNKVPPKEHLQLHIGDVIRFGQSSRLHILQGPEELRTEVLRDKMSPAEVQKMKYDVLQETKAARQRKIDAAAAAAAADVLPSEGCMWGDQDDAYDDADDENAAKGDADNLSSFGAYQKNMSSWDIGKQADAEEKAKAGMSARELDLLEKIEKRTTKMGNMNIEKERIMAKQGDGDLSAGQQSQVERNDKQTGKLNDEIEELREQLDEVRRTKARQNGEAAPEATSERFRRQQKAEERADSDEDDFFDRIEKPKTKRAVGGGRQKSASLKELHAEKVVLEAKRSDLVAKLANEIALRDSTSPTAPTLDPLDVFMADNSSAMKDQRVQELQQELDETLAKSKNVDELLAFAQPAYLRPPVAAPTKVDKQDDMFRPKLSANFADQQQVQPQEQPQHRTVISDAISSRAPKVGNAPAAGSMAAALAAARNSETADASADVSGEKTARVRGAISADSKKAEPRDDKSVPMERVPKVEIKAEDAGHRGGAYAKLPATINPDLFNGTSSAAEQQQADAKFAQMVSHVKNMKKIDVVDELRKRGLEVGLGKSGLKGLKDKPDELVNRLIKALEVERRDDRGDSKAGLGGDAQNATSKAAAAKPEKRKAAIDGKRGGLQVMGKKQKQDEPQYGRGQRRFLDDEDSLDRIEDPHPRGLAPMSVSEETEFREAEAIATETWAPPTGESQKKLANLAASLGY
jgi:pSer/pThr/pTyr-binding forkhead associated (FHA) protein